MAADSFQHNFESGLNDYNKRLIKFLVDNEMIKPGFEVADIGCGVGIYSVQFAKRGCKVTLMDISSKMLMYAERNMAEINADCRTVRCDFAEYEPEGRYNLSFASMSPVISSLETVQKMSGMTHGRCFATKFCSWEHPNGDRIFRLLDMTPRKTSSRLHEECEKFMQTVSQAGYEPQVEYADYSWNDDFTTGDMAKSIIKRYFNGDEITEELQEKIRTAAAELADSDGVIRDAVNTKVAWIYWKT